MGKDIFSKKLSQMDEHLAILLNRLEGLDHQIINTSPKEGAWSVTQVLNHMKRVEFYTHAYIQKKIKAPDLKKAGIGSKLRLYGLRAYMKSPFTFNAPKAVNTESLHAQDTISNIQSSWVVQRNKLGKFLNSLTEEQKQLLVYKHPVAGRLSFSEMLSFIETHNHHHTKQIDRTLKAVEEQI
jgi:uncharacterized damage-inducible protein DinB